MVMQPLSGIRPETPENLVFDAGVVYANIDITALEATGWEDAIEDALHLGATRGNPTFNVNRELREVEVNGTLGPVRGLTYRNMIRPTLSVELIEMTSENLKRAIAGAVHTEVGEFERISGSEITDAAYLDNIALAATLKGSEEPVVIVLFNALVHDTPDLEFEDHSELSTEVEFIGHFPLNATRDESQVWRIYRPNGPS